MWTMKILDPPVTLYSGYRPRALDAQSALLSAYGILWRIKPDSQLTELPTHMPTPSDS